MLDLPGLSVVVATFLLAGTVKGVIGLGLPTLSLGILAASMDLTTAMALMVVPSFVTNLWQCLAGGHGRAILARIWPFLLMATLTIWAGAAALIRVNVELLTVLLGALLVTYSGLNLAGIRLSISARREPLAGLVYGTTNGLLAGMTGSFVMPGVMYLQAIGLKRDELHQAMGVLFTASTIALALALQSLDVLTPRLGVVSVAATLPALVGMIIGQRIRRRLEEQHFRRIFFIGILAIGAYIMAEAAFGR